MPQFEFFIGLADCHGLSSFLPDPQINQTKLTNIIIFGEEEAQEKDKQRNSMLHGMQMSAYYNAQRRTVVYQAKVLPEVAEEIQSLMKEGENLQALIVLKSQASEIGLLQGVPNAKKYWEQIPNPDLDPFG